MKSLAIIICVFIVAVLIRASLPRHPVEVPCETIAYRKCMTSTSSANNQMRVCMIQAERIASTLEKKVCTVYE